MKIELPEKLQVYFIQEDGAEDGNPPSRNTYDAEVQVLDGNKLVLWFSDKSKKRLWKNERLLNPGLVLIAEEKIKEEN